MVLLLLASIILYWISGVNYLLFHAIVEGFAIVVAALIYVLATNTYRHTKNDSFRFLGIAYLQVAILDFVHTLTYKGMGVFPGFGSDVPAQLWIAGRMLEAVSLALVPVLFRKKINQRLVWLGYGAATTAALVSIMVFPVFPVCFIEGIGLTPFKVISEYMIVVILLGGACLLHRHKEYYSLDLFNSVGLAMIVTALSELAFTLYTDVYGVTNMVGHMLKIVSYYYVYAGVLLEGIDKPYRLVAVELRDEAMQDPLTGLYNRRGLDELLRKQLGRVSRGRESLGMLMIDLDNFKHINDHYGHLVGDSVLIQFADLLGKNVRKRDLAGRYGGDEFIVLLPNVDSEMVVAIKQRIEIAVQAWIGNDERLKRLGISIGTALLKSGQDVDESTLIKMADKSMYEAKREKKATPRAPFFFD